VFNDKKGNVLDWFLVLCILFITSIATFCAFIVIDTVQQADIFAGYDDATTSINSARSSIISMDNMFIFIIIGLSIFVMVSSAVMFNHPAMFFLSVILLFVAVTVAGVFSNTFWTFRVSDGLVRTASYFPKTVFLMEHLPIYVLLMGFASMGLMFYAYNKQ
jgi:hypothetical protein